MLDKLLKMDSALLTIKAQIAKYTALFAADGTIDATEQAFLNALEEDAKRIYEKLGKVIVKAKAVSNEKSATTEKTEELAVEEVVVTVKAADGMEELEAIPVMSGEEKGSGIEIEVPMAENMSKEYFESIVVSVDFVPRQVFIFAAVEKIINVRSDQMPPF